MRDHPNEPIPHERPADSEQDHVFAEQELLYWFGGGMKEAIPELAINHGPLQDPVRPSILIGRFLGVIILAWKDELVCEIVVDLVVINPMPTRMIAREGNPSCIECRDVPATEVPG